VRHRAAAIISGLCLLAVSCGAERPEAPPTHAQPGEPTHRVGDERAGLSASVPTRVAVERRRLPAVFRAALGESVVGAFAYRRREQLPRDARELQTARRRLVAEARRRGGRERRLRLIRSRATRVAGARAIELLADQTIARTRLRTRSLHVFKGRGEYVIDMLAPVRGFRDADRAFFAPLVRSLRLSGRIQPQPRRGRPR
jgi:hypothetical protein